jgi:hypothetical protein
MPPYPIQHILPNPQIPTPHPILHHHRLPRLPRILPRPHLIPHRTIRQRRKAIRNIHEALQALVFIQLQELDRKVRATEGFRCPVIEVGLEDVDTG